MRKRQAITETAAPRPTGRKLESFHQLARLPYLKSFRMQGVRLMDYPFPRYQQITFAQAVNLIAEAVYPGENQRLARKRVRQRIKDNSANLKGYEPPGWHDQVPTTHFPFFGWARDVKGWGNLASIEGLPYVEPICIDHLAPVAEIPEGVFHRPPLEIPDDCEALRWKCVASELELRELRHLRDRVAVLEKKLAETTAAHLAKNRKKSNKGKWDKELPKEA